MSDLISRSTLLKMLNYNKEMHEDESGETRQLIAVDINKMIEYIERMPVAYDVNAVVVELIEEANNTIVDFKKDKYIYTSKAIEIVREGGVE